MKNATLNLPLDLTKRHFIVGDIHGRLETLMALLESADYDPENDILYTVGDMIDRGPHSVEVIEFFQEHNRYSIRGNHEVMVTDPDWYLCWLQNGGIQTQLSLSEHLLDENWLKSMIRSLPYFIDVGEQGEEHAFRIIHAEQPPTWSEEVFQHVIETSEADNDNRFAHVLWSRTTIETAKRNISNLKPISTDIEFDPNRSGRNIFVGHSPIRKVMRVGDMTFLDTWASKTMSMVEAVTHQVWSVPYRAKVD